MFGKGEYLLIARSKFAEREEDSINHSEGAHILRLGELLVGARHDETNDSLQGYANGECIAWAYPVTNKGSKNSSGNIK